MKFFKSLLEQLQEKQERIYTITVSIGEEIKSKDYEKDNLIDNYFRSGAEVVGIFKIIKELGIDTEDKAHELLKKINNFTIQVKGKPFQLSIINNLSGAKNKVQRHFIKYSYPGVNGSIEELEKNIEDTENSEDKLNDNISNKTISESLAFFISHT